MKAIKFVDILEVNDSLKEKVRLWRNKEPVRKYMLSQHIITHDEHSNWLENLKNQKRASAWVIFVDDIPIGLAYLQNIDCAKLTTEWGFYIGEDAYRGKGLAKGILFEFFKMVFEQLTFRMLFTKVLSNNAVALSIYSKFNFYEIRKELFENTKEVIVYELTQENWLKSKAMIWRQIVNSKEALYLCRSLRFIHLARVIWITFVFRHTSATIYYQKTNKLAGIFEKYQEIFSRIFVSHIKSTQLPDDFKENNVYLNIFASRRIWVDVLYEISRKLDKDVLLAETSLLNSLEGKLYKIKNCLRLFMKHDVALDIYDDLFLVEIATRLVKNTQTKFYNTNLTVLLDRRNYWSNFVIEYAKKNQVAYLINSIFLSKNNKAIKFCFNVFQLLSEFISSLFRAKTPTYNNRLNMVGIAHYGFSNFTEFFNKRNYYLFWYLCSGIDPNRILIYSDGKPNISKEEKKKIADLGFKILSCCSLFRKRILSSSSPNSSGVNVPAYKCTSMAIKYLLRYLKESVRLLVHVRTKAAFEQWKNLALLFTKLAYWEDFFRSNNIKINFRFQDSFNYCDIAANLAGAVTISYNYTSHHPEAIDVTHNDMCDVFFVWGKRYQDCFLNEHSEIKNFVQTGYIFDYTFNALRESSAHLRRFFTEKGRNFIITILDESLAVGMYRRETLNLYKSLFEFLVNNSDSNLIIKPKKNYTRNILESSQETSDLFRSLEKEERLKVLDIVKYPAEAGMASNLVIGVSVLSGAVLECALANIPTVVYDIEKMQNIFKVEGIDEIAFSNIGKMLDLTQQYMLNGNKLNGFADWSKFLKDVDPFRDGMANRRIGLYIKTLLDGFDSGLTKKESIVKANKFYSEAFGTDKVFAVNP